MDDALILIDCRYQLVFEITAKHIKEANRRDERRCVIGLAIADHYKRNKHYKSVVTGSSTVKIHEGNFIWRYSTPYNLAEAIRRFDNTGYWKLDPGYYVLLPYRHPVRYNGPRQRAYYGLAERTRVTTKYTRM